VARAGAAADDLVLLLLPPTQPAQVKPMTAEPPRRNVRRLMLVVSCVGGREPAIHFFQLRLVRPDLDERRRRIADLAEEATVMLKVPREPAI
jgi:hypothetical protein